MKKINKTQKAVSKKSVNSNCTENEHVKDHIENNFTGCDKLICNFGDKRIELDRHQQKEILEFIYVISSREYVEHNPLVIEGMKLEQRVRNAMLHKMKCIIFSAPYDELMKYSMKILGIKEEENMTVN